MGFFDNMTKDKYGKIIISIIWGLGLAALFRRVCKGRNCIVIKGGTHIMIINKYKWFNENLPKLIHDKP